MKLADEIRLAEQAATGGLLAKVRFRRFFNPRRTLALLRAYENAAHASVTEREQREHEQTLREQESLARRLEHEALAIAEKRLLRAQQLVPRWRASTPGVDNGWADELEEALSDVADGIVALSSGTQAPTQEEVHAMHDAVHRTMRSPIPPRG